MDEKLKILVVVTTFPAITETFILNQITDLIDRGHDVTVFTYNSSPDKIEHPLYRAYRSRFQTVTHFKNKLGLFGKTKAFFSFLTKHFWDISWSKVIKLIFSFSIKRWKVYYDLPVLLFKKNFDIIHAHFGFNGKKMTDALQMKLATPQRFVVSFHGSDLTPSKVDFYKTLYANLFKRVDWVTVNSPYLRDILLRVCPGFNRYSLLPEGFKAEVLSPFLQQKKTSRRFEIVYCGRLIGWKGPDRAVAVIDELKKRGHEQVLLHLIGQGELYEKIEQYIRENDLDSQVIMHGAVTQDKVFEIMAGAHTFLLPGVPNPYTQRVEAQGLVIQEAQYFKLPVVVSDTGGSKYGFLDGETGFLILGEDIMPFVDCIEKLIKNPETGLQMGEKGHQWVRENYDVKILGKRLLQLYEGETSA
jgi:colanic acid/amylovoran biosynthesis glycosyltransferase